MSRRKSGLRKPSPMSKPLKTAEEGVQINLSEETTPGFDEHCVFRILEDDKPTCNVTGLGVDCSICQACSKDVRDHTPGTLTKLSGYFIAVRNWVKAGRPLRPDSEVDEIFNTHCKPCDRYNPDTHSCNECGCAVSTSDKPLVNKLKMATEHCPLGRF